MAHEPGLGGPHFGQAPLVRIDPRTSGIKTEIATPQAEGPGTLPSRSNQKILSSGNIFGSCGTSDFFQF